MSVPTPPPTSTSPAESPTTSNPELGSRMTTVQPVRPLYFIVAVSLSPPLGIGLNGTLPWGALKSDMAFFARVTKRAAPGRKNTVVMGRKTYESIPPKFRPLQARRNIVITRSGATELEERFRSEVKEEARKDICCVPSLQAAVELLRDSRSDFDKVFIIGGAQIYKTALEADYNGVFTHLRILQSEVQRKDGAEQEIDTFFPIDARLDNNWRMAEDAEVAEWVGEDAPQVKSGDKLWKEDGDYKFRTVGLEKELPIS